MPTLLLFASVLAPAADPVKVEDVKRFANGDRHALQVKRQESQFFGCYLFELASSARDYKTQCRMLTEYQKHTSTQSLYSDVYFLTDPSFSERDKLVMLARLRNKIGEAAYQAGGMPPPYPPQYEQEFTAWLAKTKAASFGTLRALKEHLQAQREQTADRNKQEDVRKKN